MYLGLSNEEFDTDDKDDVDILSAHVLSVAIWQIVFV
jgi:hypothetical protein